MKIIRALRGLWRWIADVWRKPIRCEVCKEKACFLVYYTLQEKPEHLFEAPGMSYRRAGCTVSKRTVLCEACKTQLLTEQFAWPELVGYRAFSLCDGADEYSGELYPS